MDTHKGQGVAHLITEDLDLTEPSVAGQKFFPRVEQLICVALNVKWDSLEKTYIDNKICSLAEVIVATFKLTDLRYTH